MTPALDAVRREELRTTIVTALYGAPIERPESTEELLAALIDIARRPALLAYIAELEAGAAAMVAKLDVIHADPVYKSVWTLSQLRGVPYAGPNYRDELEALRALLPKASVREELDSHDINRKPTPEGK